MATGASTRSSTATVAGPPTAPAYDKDRFEVCNQRWSALCDEEPRRRGAQ